MERILSFQHQPTKIIIHLMTIMICTGIIIISLFLFIFDQGNIICYAKEKIQGWNDPSYHEMKDFLDQDLTNYKEFTNHHYECKDFTIDLIKMARKQGYRAGYVTLHNPTGYNHAICCFNTIDKGLIFVEPQNDCIISQDDMKQMIKQGEYSLEYSYGVEGFLEQSLSSYSISWYMII